MIDIPELANRLFPDTGRDEPHGVEALRDALVKKIPGRSLTTNTIYNWNRRQKIGGGWELAFVEVAADHGITLTLADLRGEVMEAAQ